MSLRSQEVKKLAQDLPASKHQVRNRNLGSFLSSHLSNGYSHPLIVSWSILGATQASPSCLILCHLNKRTEDSDSIL